MPRKRIATWGPARVAPEAGCVGGGKFEKQRESQVHGLCPGGWVRGLGRRWHGGQEAGLESARPSREA